MDMKWNPIIDGDLSEVPCDEEVIFTVLDEETGEFYTATAEVNESFLEHGYVFVGELIVDVDFKSLKAWMKLPEPYVPGMCGICKHCRVWIDGFGDRWSKCELMGIATFVPLKCPLKK